MLLGKAGISHVKGGAGLAQEVAMDTTTLLIIIIVLIVIGGGGWYGRGRWF
jgi:hypothetical protein